jgi:hypothetical protein
MPETHDPKVRYRDMTQLEVAWVQYGSGNVQVCEDCGVLVIEKAAHTRHHSIESSWAWALAVLKTAHIAEHVHDRYEVPERIDSKQFDNWSADALAEVMAEMPPDEGESY